MSCVIYKITSPSGRVYIGQAIDFELRMSKYKALSCKGQPRLYLSLKKYGFNNHVITIIEHTRESELNDREAFWQKYYNVLSKSGLNCKIQSSGGKSGKLSDETKSKISESHKGKTFRKETLEKMRLAKIGKKMPEDQRKRMVGRKLPPEQIEVMRSRMIGNQYTKGIKPVNSKKVIDESTGIIYESATDAAKAIGLKRTTLTARLARGSKKNTNMRYL